jgi:glycosyltransferase involved in cell wall biosynthesis
MQNNIKLIRTATIAASLDILLKGQLHYLNNYFEVIAVSGNDKHLQTIKRREGVTIIDVPISRKINIFFDIVSLFRLYRTFRKEKPTIVHSITPKAGLLSMTAAWLARVPIRMHTFTGLVFPTQRGLMKKILIATDKIVCRMATNVYPEGKGVKNDLIANAITSKPLKVLANGNVNGIDTAFFDTNHFTDTDKQSLRKKWNIHPEDFIFVFVGRLVGDKGINELVQAFSKINVQHESIKLVLVGAYEHDLDPLRPLTLDIIYNNPNIITTDFQDDIRPFLAMSDVFVFPSYREGFPNVVMQAGAMELPSIVTDINGCNEIIQHNCNGIIISSKDTITLTHAMQQLIEDPTFCQSLAQNARPYITSRYEQQMVWDTLLAEYQLLLIEKVVK